MKKRIIEWLWGHWHISRRNHPVSPSNYFCCQGDLGRWGGFKSWQTIFCSYLEDIWRSKDGQTGDKMYKRKEKVLNSDITVHWIGLGFEVTRTPVADFEKAVREAKKNEKNLVFK